MAILWMDGFDHYGGLDANIALAGYSYSGSMVFDSTIKRSGAYSVYNSNGFTLYKTLPSAKTLIGCAAGIYIGQLPATSQRLFVFEDNIGTANITLWITAAGNIRATRGGTFTSNILGESDPIINASVWNHVEAKASFSDTVGIVEVRVNEFTVLNLTALDTVSGANASCSIVGIYSATARTVRVGDFVIWDDSGTSNNDFIGDRRVLTLLPNANEATQEMTVTGAANAYTAIQSADGDTSYIAASDSVPVTSEFALEDPGATVGAINAVQVVTLMRKIEAGPANVQASLLSGSDASAGTNHSITDSYAYYADIHNTDPATGAPWSASGLAAARLRLRRNT